MKIIQRPRHYNISHLKIYNGIIKTHMQQNHLPNQISMVVHVGSHIGQEVETYRALGVQQIVWIEADATVYQRLQANIRAKEADSTKRISHIFINALVGEVNNEVIKFYPFNNDRQSSSRYKPTQRLKDTWVGLDSIEEPEELKTYRLDSILDSLKISEEMYSNAKLVIDVQGGEYEVLMGMGRYIEKFNLLEVEVSKEEIYEGQKIFGYIDNFLALKNFRRKEVDISEIPWHGNVTYFRDRAREVLSSHCTGYFSSLLIFKQIESNPVFQNDQTKFVEYCARNRNSSYSQLFQDLLVLHLLREKSNGYFVEFGAADGVFLSNTYLLEKNFGWTGIVCEPARSWEVSLRKNRSAAIDCRCVFHASGLKLPFLDVPNPELSTLESYSQLDLHASNRTSGQQYLVDTVSLEDLLDQHHAPQIIDFISIDTEGSEFDILKVFNFNKYQFRIIAVEHNHTELRTEIYNLLVMNGYVRIFKDLSGFDDWYVLSSAIQLNY